MKCGHPSDCLDNVCLDCEDDRHGKELEEIQGKLKASELQVGVLRKVLEEALEGIKCAKKRGDPPYRDDIIDIQQALQKTNDLRKESECNHEPITVVWLDNLSAKAAKGCCRKCFQPGVIAEPKS